MILRWLLFLLLLWVAWRTLRAYIAPPGSRAEAASDPHSVLGVRRGATAAEIAQAYRERMKEYHPDRVADLGPELRELAHRKTIEIQQAQRALRPAK